MARQNTVQDIDRGWDRIKRQTRGLDGKGVKVGVQGDYNRKDGADMILIALANEFGTDDGHVPARPFIRGAYGEYKQDIGHTKDRLWRLILSGKLDAQQALGLLGEKHQGHVQDYMTALDQPPNAPSTVRRKTTSAGVGDNPLIDTGALRRGIRWEIE